MKKVYIVKDAGGRHVLACEEYSDALDMAQAVTRKEDVAELAEHIETMPVIETIGKPFGQRGGAAK